MPSFPQRTLRAVVCEREHRIRSRLAALEEVGLRACTPFFTPSGSARPAPATARVFGHNRPAPSFARKPSSRQAAPEPRLCGPPGADRGSYTANTPNPTTHPNGGALDQWAYAFGIGRATGIGLPGELNGTLPTPKWQAERNQLERECEQAAGPFKGHREHSTCGIANGRPWSINDNIDLAVGPRLTCSPTSPNRYTARQEPPNTEANKTTPGKPATCLPARPANQSSSS
jgi:hypothetical protein